MIAKKIKIAFTSIPFECRDVSHSGFSGITGTQVLSVEPINAKKLQVIYVLPCAGEKTQVSIKILRVGGEDNSVIPGLEGFSFVNTFKVGESSFAVFYQEYPYGLMV